MLLTSLGRTAGWEELTERHLIELRARGVDVQAIRERLSAEGALRPDATGRIFVLAEKLDAHARAMLGVPAVFDGPPRAKHILEVMPRGSERTFDEVFAETFSGGGARRQLAAAKIDERRRKRARCGLLPSRRHSRRILTP